jgi:hypothetical protein
MTGDLRGANDADWSEEIEATDFGMGRRLRSPLSIDGRPLRWDHPAAKLGSAQPVW